MNRQRIYLDNAATSWPKPRQVASEVNRYLTHLGAPAGRAGYSEAAEVEAKVEDTRLALARMLGCSRQNVVFTFNGTDSLNLAIHGLLRPGDHVITSRLEHNSVLRPLSFHERSSGVAVTRVGCDVEGHIMPADIAEALRPETRLVVITHASNVSGTLQAVEEIGRSLHAHDCFFLVDAAQTAGHVPIDLTQMGADMLACSAHKGLMGPLGLGVLCVNERANESLVATRQGGTGTASDQDRQPSELPAKLESGNHNVPAIFGLAAALDWINSEGIDNLHGRIQSRITQLLQGLQALSGVTVYGPTSSQDNAGVVSLNVAGFGPQEVAGMLDSAYSIQVRAGIHCAPHAHAAFQTLDQSGTVRFSPGVFSSEADIDLAIEAVREIASAGGN